MKKFITFIVFLIATFSFAQGQALLGPDNFDKETSRGIIVVEFWASWNDANKVTLLDEWETFDAKVYRLNIDLYPKVQSKNGVVILPTIIFYDDGEEVERLQGDMSFSLKVTKEELEEIVEEVLGSKF